MSKRGKKTELYSQVLKAYYTHKQDLGIHIPAEFVLTERQEEVLELMSEGLMQITIASDLNCRQTAVVAALKAGIKKVRALDLWVKEKEKGNE